MTLDFDKLTLTPAPWMISSENALHVESADGRPVASTERRTSTVEDDHNAAFIALARNAFDVMLRRWWMPVIYGSKWGVSNSSYPNLLPTRLIHLCWPDPFTALVEADKWYREHVEAKEATA